MGFFSFLRRASSASHATDPEKQPEQNDEQDTTSVKGFLSSFCSCGHAKDEVEEQQERPRRRDKPPKYNRHNLPSIVVDDPPPWVKSHHKLEQRSDGTLFVTSLPQTE